jgi:flagellar biosynthetic protein FlhB
MADSSQRTEKATPQRLKKAREKGDFPAAREFVAAFQFMAFVILASAWFPGWLSHLEAITRMGMRRAFFSGPGSLTSSDLLAMFALLARTALMPLAVLGGLLMSFTIFLQLVSNNMGFSLAKLAPNFNRLNPVSRVKDIPATNMGNFFQAVVMMPVMFWLTWSLVRDRLPDLLRLPLMPVASGAVAAGALIHDALRRAAFVLVVLGAIMLVRERGRYGKRLRMSKQEIRDEAKETDGNPQIKARIRRIQRDLSRRNMMKEVASATAVIVNPTHYAVALRYEQGVMTAPRVVAKGKNFLAARIRQRAIQNQVPIIENPPLAQALYKSMDVGQDIPAHLYRAVAEILAYIFRIMGKGAQA